MLQKLYLEDKEQKIPRDKYLWEERPQWKVGFINFQMKSPLLIVMQNIEDFLIFRWGWDLKGTVGISLPPYSFAPDLYWKRNWDPTCSFSLSVTGTINIHEISCNFVGQSCLYFTYSRTIKGTGNSTHVQILRVELPGETRGRMRILTNKIQTTDNLET